MIGLSFPAELWADTSDDTEALLEEWHVAVGGGVVAGQVLVTAVLVKTSVELVAPADGVLDAILVPAGETFARGATLGTLALRGQEALAPPDAPALDPPPSHEAGGATGRVVPFTGLRGSIARNLSQAWQAPRVAAGAEVDMTACLARLAALRAASGGARVTLTALLIRAAALALRAHPRMNALVSEQGVERPSGVHIALAVSLDDGLLTPVIRDADAKSALEIAAEAAELAAAARAGSLSPGALQGGTFTLTNLGAAGVDWFTPVLNPPQAGILGVGQVADRPVARAGGLAVAPCITLTLVFDHRAIDGHPAALFLAAVRDLLEDASQL